MKSLRFYSTETFLRVIAIVSAAVLVTSCGSVFYAKTPIGKFSGKLYVEWISPNQFIYRPDASDPLTYTTSSGIKIVPRLMYTDGGSIPRLFWSSSGLGPWDFAPGYIVHDWLFQQHHCKLDDWQSYDFQRSADVLAEALKTQMVKGGKAEPAIVYAVYEAVRSPIAEELWRRGDCKEPSSAPPAPGALPPPTPLVILTVDIH